MTNYKYIEEKAEALLKSNNLYRPGFSIKNLVKKLGIDLVKSPPQGADVSGYIVMTNDRSTIVYTETTQGRDRFTIAHELGHFILHRKSQQIFIDKSPKIFYRDSASSTGDILKEREANAFAAALIMPKALVVEELQKISFDIDVAIKHLPDRFQVSERAMLFRLSNLGFDIGL